MKREYPLAVQEEKVILPVEMVVTDKRQLAEKYKGIPEHDFFIGLAYLRGIDVEVDYRTYLQIFKAGL